ncbi:hypothetical protein ARHIZOSPH14_21460 [Agromyces rhizosphaerae]|uniref:Uncharacterized protein n=1 Tax=Agromyces rhizosphaerae TaxID=88374 RepID=A0A9W6CW59_9MICO|nr:hypothetical protein [Agromyces rhizosphaerae]GLI27904.1 hypothetical protein ARHIZOSPH14_21460 [Agromyces rhizosphaerae]
MSDGADEAPRTDDEAATNAQPRTGAGPSKRTIGLIAAGAGALVLLISGSVALGMVAGAAMVRSQAAPVVEAASATDAPETPAPETPSASPTPSPEDSTAAAPAPAPPAGGADDGSGGDGTADGGVQQLRVSVQPISVCYDDGSQCAPVGAFEARTNEILEPAGITVEVLPTVELHRSSLVTGGCGREFLTAAHVAGDSYEDPAPIRYYVADCERVGAGHAWTGFNGFVVKYGEPDPAGKLPAMYLAANLGVPYTYDQDSPARLMERSTYGVALTEAEIEMARASHFLAAAG